MSHTRYPSHCLNISVLYDMLDERRGDLNVSWYIVGIQTGVSRATFSRMKQDPGTSISASAFLSLLVWLGKAAPLAELIVSPLD